MPAPLVGLAIGAAAKMAAKKLAQKTAKKTITAVAKKPVSKRAAVKVVKPLPAATREYINKNTTNITNARKSGLVASQLASGVKTGMPKATVKIKSGGDIKPAFSKKAKPMSYSQLKDMPNLVKIDSAKGNTVKKIAYRKRSSN